MAITGFSNYLELELLDHLFGKGAYTPPTIHLALSTADPEEDESGVAEPSGNGYARVETSASDWAAASAGAISNAAALSFPEASGSWGTITYLVLYDASTAGNMLAAGALTESKAIGNGEVLQFAIGGIDVTLT
jgi:hypothetical protein